MNVPKYVWVSGIVILSLAELRKWLDLYLTFSENDEDNNDEIPEFVQHLYS